MLKIAIASVAATMIATSPAGAAQVSKDTQAAQSAKARQDVANADPKRKICIRLDDIVGSRVRKVECKSKADWQSEGVDFDRDLK